MDINFYFEHVGDYARIANRDTRDDYIEMFLTYLREVGLPYEISNSILPNHKNIILYSSMMNIPNEMRDENIFGKHANANTIEILRRKEASLVYMISSESLRRHREHFKDWKKLHVEEYGIPESQIYFLSANLRPDSPDQLGYDYWQHDHSLVTRRQTGENFRWSFTERPFHRKLSVDELDREKVDIDLYVSKPKYYLFLSYNRQPREHRWELLSRLRQQGILEQGLVSQLAPKEQVEQLKVGANRFVRAEDYRAYLSYMANYKPVHIDRDFMSLIGAHDRNYNYLHHYASTYFSLVTETYASTNNDDILWLTEKTYKPIACGHPFIVYGCRGTLAYLREQGYETFPEIFDESYDNIVNAVQRREAIVAEMKRLADMPRPELAEKTKLVIDKLRHNRNLLITKSYKPIYERIFTQL